MIKKNMSLNTFHKCFKYIQNDDSLLEDATTCNIKLKFNFIQYETKWKRNLNSKTSKFWEYCENLLSRPTDLMSKAIRREVAERGTFLIPVGSVPLKIGLGRGDGKPSSAMVSSSCNICRTHHQKSRHIKGNAGFLK